MKKFFSEPLLQFFILGSLLYLLVSFMQAKREVQSRQVNVGKEQVRLLAIKYKSQMGELPTKAQLESLIEDYIREEIYYREAKQLRLDENDEIIRRRLSQKFDFINSDIDEIAEPKETQLKEFYKSNPTLFQTESVVSFSHIYFNVDNSTDSVTKLKASGILETLRGSGLRKAPDKGDRFALQYDFTDQTELDIRQNFGNKPIVDSLFNASVNTWVGPVQSGYGWHLLFITKRDGATIIPYDAAKGAVKERYIESVKEEKNQKVYQQLMKKYEIKRTYLESK